MKAPLPLINQSYSLLQTENFELAAKDCELIAIKLSQLNNSELTENIKQLEELKAKILAIRELANRKEYETWTQDMEWAYLDTFNACIKKYECWMNEIQNKLNKY